MNRTMKTGLVILVLVLSIVFAAVTTNLIINGTVKFVAGDISSLVYFTKATPETGGTASILQPSKKTITYTTKQLTSVGDTATLEYTVLNDSTQYDVDVTMSIEFNNPSIVDEYLDITYTGFTPSEFGNSHKVRIIGKHSSDGKIEITLKKNSLSSMELSFTITLDVVAASRASEITKDNGNYIMPEHNNAYCSHDYDGELVYYDPVTENPCNKNTFSVDAINAGTSTCYAWRVISKCDNNFNIQLDHSLAGSAWSFVNPDTYGPVTVLRTLQSLTSTWTRVDPINYEYRSNIDIATGGAKSDRTDAFYEGNYTVLTCVNGRCTTPGYPSYNITTNLRARLITYEEIKEIYGDDNPTKTGNIHRADDVLIISSANHSNSSFNVGNRLWWLFENTETTFNCNNNNYTNVHVTTGSTCSVYNVSLVPPSAAQPEATYWTLSQGVKTPGVAGQDQVGYQNFAIGVRNNERTEPYENHEHVGGAGFHFTRAVGGVRPLITIPVTQVSFDSE